MDVQFDMPSEWARSCATDSVAGSRSIATTFPTILAKGRVKRPSPQQRSTTNALLVRLNLSSTSRGRGHSACHQSASGIDVAGKNPFNSFTVSGQGTGSHRPRSALRSSRLRLLGTCQSADRSLLRQTPFPPASSSRLHTADHRRFKPSRDRCFEQQPREPADRSRCRQIPDIRPAAARGEFP